MRQGWIMASVLFAVMGWGPLAQAQSPEIKLASGAYQGEYAFQVGEELDPLVDIDGLQWTLLKVAPKKEGRIPPDKTIDIVVLLGFHNISDDKKRANVVLMFEDEDGNRVGERLQLKEVRVGKGDDKVFDQKTEINGSVLIATRKIYVLCEVE